MDYVAHYISPLGGIRLLSDGENLTGLWFDGQKFFGFTMGSQVCEKKLNVFEESFRWLELYFGGKQPDFLPPLKYGSTPFRKTVCDIMLTIPYGKTMTYGEIAARSAQVLGVKKMSAQAVGGAVGHNPISLMIPCHRVLGSGGKLTGYAGGLDRKSKLLQLENGKLSFF